MDKATTSGLIFVKGECNLEYALCKITYTVNADDTFSYVFTPNYSVISLLDSTYFQGIPGLDLSLHKKEYVRDKFVPTFIAERVPAPNREDFYELLKEVNMTYMNPIEYLIRVKTFYSGDQLYVKEYVNPKTVEVVENGKENVMGLLKSILSNICLGNNVLFEGVTIDDASRKDMFKVLFGLYRKSFYAYKEKQEAGIAKAKKKQAYKGRKPIQVDELLFLTTLEEYKKKEITAIEAAKKIGISIDKFYRMRSKAKLK